MLGAEDIHGHSFDHWLTSTTVFTVIMHIIILKLMLETTYWNTISMLTCLFCLFLYYGVLALGNLNPFAGPF